MFFQSKGNKKQSKQSQKFKNINKIAHHVATWRIRALKIHPGAPKGASNEASDHWGRVLCEGIPYLCEVRKLCE
jgi:hypothetical protein